VETQAELRQQAHGFHPYPLRPFHTQALQHAHHHPDLSRIQVAQPHHRLERQHQPLALVDLLAQARQSFCLWSKMALAQAVA